MTRHESVWVVCAATLVWVTTASAEGDNARVAGVYNGMTGEITVTAIGNDKIQANFMLQAVGLPNSGEANGSGELKNGLASIVAVKGPPACILTLKFSGNGKLDVSQQGSTEDCGFGMNVTADGSYTRTKGPPKVTPTVAGAPSEADCKHIPSPRGRPSTQLEMNEAEAAKAAREACRMRAAYLGLDKSVLAKPGASEALAAAQQAWSAFLDAHEFERFPHEDEQGYYGSMLPMCIGAENQTMYRARTAELKGMKPCTEKIANVAKAESDAQTAEAELRAVIAKLKTNYAKDPKFIGALAKTEGAFDALRRAQGAYAFAASGNNAACQAREVARMTQQRTAQLKLWFDAKAAQDTSCSGSYEGLSSAAAPAPQPTSPHLLKPKK